MKKIILLLTILFTIVFISYSCSDDDNTREPYDITNGTWIFKERYISTTINDGIFDNNINSNLKKDGDTLRIEQIFNNSSKRSTLIAYSLKSGQEVRSSEYRFAIKDDSIYLLNPVIMNDTVMRGAYLATKHNNKAKLDLKYQINKNVLSPILLDLNIDNNILDSYPDNLGGTYYITAEQ